MYFMRGCMTLYHVTATPLWQWLAAFLLLSLKYSSYLPPCSIAYFFQSIHEPLLYYVYGICCVIYSWKMVD